jgi:transcriptional regulator with XRE-family HTH domain
MTIESDKIELLIEQYPNGVPADVLFDALGLPEITLGNTIRCWRKCENWTLADAAQRLNCSKQLLSDYERGVKLPSIKKIIEMAEVFEVDPIMWLQYRLKDELRLNGYDAQMTLTKIA